MSDQIARIVNSGIQAGVQAAKTAIVGEAVAQIKPHVDRAKNGLGGFLGTEPDQPDDEGDDDDSDAVAVDPCEMVYFFGLDQGDDAETATSCAVAVFRVCAMPDGKKPSHYIATHPDGFAAVGPADLLEDEVIAKSELAGISHKWTMLRSWQDCMGLDYDIGDIADFAAEACDDDEEFADQQEAHNAFNWEHHAQSVSVVDVPGVKSCWQIGHALQVKTDRALLDWEQCSPLPFAYAIDTETLLVHGAHVCVTAQGVKVSNSAAPSYADWRQQFSKAEPYQIDGIATPCYLLGKAKVFDYRSNKDDKNPAKFKDYTHEHGEESGEFPDLFAVGPRTFAICGGNMWVAPEGIRD